MILTLATRRMVDGFATTDTHPAVWFLVQLHIARGSLTWEDLETDAVSSAQSQFHPRGGRLP